MAKCKFCGKSGWFFNVDENGLCNECAEYVYPTIENSKRIISKSFDITADSKQPSTVVARREVMLKHLDDLKNREQRNPRI